MRAVATRTVALAVGVSWGIGTRLHGGCLFVDDAVVVVTRPRVCDGCQKHSDVTTDRAPLR